MDIEEARKWLSDKEIKIVSERAGIQYMRLWRFSTGQQKQLKARDWDLLQAYIAQSCGCIHGLGA